MRTDAEIEKYENVAKKKGDKFWKSSHEERMKMTGLKSNKSKSLSTKSKALRA